MQTYKYTTHPKTNASTSNTFKFTMEQCLKSSHTLPVNCRSWSVNFLIQDAALKFIVLQRKIYLHIIT